MTLKLDPLGDLAVVATLGTGIDSDTLASVLNFAEAVGAAKAKGITDIVPAYASVTVFYDPSQFSDLPGGAYETVCKLMESCSQRAKTAPGVPASRFLEIPVCYGGEFGPDMEIVSEHCRIGSDDVGSLHSGADYTVHAIGFTPGFPYLGGLPEPLRTPRRDTPRARVAAGSVAIGGSQTGVYPVASPGGWQIIGRTPLALFRPHEEPAALLRPGDRVRFRPITEAEFQTWK